MKLSRRVGDGARIPTSSMADIAFLLIIFFMVTTVFSATKGLELKLPTDDKTPADSDNEAVLIRVEAERILVDCREMSVAQILPYLEPKLVRNPSKAVILYPTSDAQYRRMVAVYDVLAGTRAADSPWPFVVRDVFIPTRREVGEYVAAFGSDPFAARCD